ncbi:tripartite tricarboxylate transporter substrate binding protein [Variovorax sp. YR216]|uniref:Bug family tripartite tricarboxylate transporter substrate binding protein n=1 Tax=Variovorax sp. YR216 TaxID=1882828 RepID=UPI00089BF6D3|nr:tripartite tricarboxylate transporter substrate-binding protein [Variovorax sp. YR216]SEB14492.1 Tripartite-type tricarboxylate transporter, receptor component TctC [Variovorax sp. YR216]
MNLPRRRFLAASAAALTPMIGPAARAQPAPTPGFPVRPVRLIVPFPPGGATDALARQIAENLARQWQHPVVVDNRPGANTMLGTEVVARSAPDGHTLGIVTGSHVINPMLSARMPYDTLRDLTGVMLLTRFHMALYAHPSLPASTPAELVQLARRDPGRVAYAYATTQTLLAMELLNTMAGTRMQSVPYKGSAQAMTDLLGGHVQLLADPLTQGAMEHVRNGRLKLIGTMGERPAALAPQASLMSQAVPGYEFSGAFGLVARGGTPPALVSRIRDDFAAVLGQSEVLARIRDIGQEPIGSTSGQYNAYILAEMAKWEPVIKSTGARLD